MARQVHPSDGDWDDGGTPSWRARQIILRPKTSWQRVPVAGLFLLGYIGPFVILLLGALLIIGGALIGDLLH